MTTLPTPDNGKPRRRMMGGRANPGRAAAAGALAALFALAGCADSPPPPAPPPTLAAAVFCADYLPDPPQTQPVRVEDKLCEDSGPTPHDPQYDWATQQLPGRDDDPDPDAGGSSFVFIGGSFGGPGYSRGYPSNIPPQRIAKGINPRGGTLTRFGGGSAGSGSLGSTLRAPGNTAVKAGTPAASSGYKGSGTVARGGLGSPGGSGGAKGGGSASGGG